MSDRYARAMREHPEGGWRNPLWRSMAVLSILMVLALVATTIGLVLFLATR